MQEGGRLGWVCVGRRGEEGGKESQIQQHQRPATSDQIPDTRYQIPELTTGWMGKNSTIGILRGIGAKFLNVLAYGCGKIVSGLGWGVDFSPSGFSGLLTIFK